MNDIVCHFCQESGHKKVVCGGYKQSVARRHFGDYAHEILEGRQAMLDDSLTHVKTPLDEPEPEHDDELESEDDDGTVSIRSVHEEHDADYDKTTDSNNATNSEVETEQTKCNKTENEVQVTHKPQQGSSTPRKSETLAGDSVYLVLGDSNSRKLHFKDSDVYNIFFPGASAAGVDAMLKKAKGDVGKKTVKRVVMHLGTIDVSRNKNDPNQVILEITTAVGKVHKEYPEAEIAFSSIIPRRGKSEAIKTLNTNSKTVNEFMIKMAQRETYLFYLDNDQDLVNNGIPIKSLYDANDVLGIHVSSKGADVLEDTMLTFLFSGLDTEAASDETRAGREIVVFFLTHLHQLKNDFLNQINFR